MNTRSFARLTWLLFALGAAVSWAVFTLYTRPAFLQVLANQLWGCL